MKHISSAAALVRRHGRLFLASLLLSQAVLADAAPQVAPVARLKLFAEGFTSPLNLVPLPDDSGRLIVGDQVGPIHVLNRDGQRSGELFLDLTSRMVQLAQGFEERGVLGLAFHPKFKENRRFFVYYSAERRPSAVTNFNHTSRLSEFQTVAGNPAKADPATEKILLEIDEPQANHNGGRMAFGPDGYLYVGIGDGGQGNDEGWGHSPNGNGQDTTTLLGKILRLDIDAPSPHVPKNNPFVGKAGFRPEIYAYGIRNPWGISFDRGGDHELFVADVGQGLYEEVNIVTSGGNYGWRVREGFHGFDPKSVNQSPTNAPTVDARGLPFVDPIFEYKHPPRGKIDPTALVGISVTGGFVYRGQTIPGWTGKYVFGDWSRSWALPDGVFFIASRPASGKGRWTLEQLPVEAPNGKLGGYITAFGQDAEGELYVMTNGRNSVTGQTGKVYKLEPANP